MNLIVLLLTVIVFCLSLDTKSWRHKSMFSWSKNWETILALRSIFDLTWYEHFSCFPIDISIIKNCPSCRNCVFALSISKWSCRKLRLLEKPSPDEGNLHASASFANRVFVLINNRDCNSEVIYLLLLYLSVHFSCYTKSLFDVSGRLSCSVVCWVDWARCLYAYCGRTCCTSFRIGREVE